MSKIGKKLISVPEGVQIVLQPPEITVKGPKGELKLAIHPKVLVKAQDKELLVSVKDPADRRQRALWGTFRSLLQNMITGVTEGFERRLEIVGVGYKAALVGNKMVLNLGYSHPVELAVPAGLEAKIEKNTIIITGPNRQMVGEFAALIRSRRKPEPYKGKGIRYTDEVVRRKAGKVVKAVGGA